MTTMTTTTPSTPTSPPKRRRRTRRLVITLVVVIGLLVAADFSAAAIFEYQVSKKAREQLNLTDDPAVRVNGFSFLVQAIAGEYSDVSIDAKGVPVKDTLRDLEIHADLRGVQIPFGDLVSQSVKQVKVQEIEGEIKIKASDVNRAIAANKNPLIQSITNLTIDPVSEADVQTDPGERTEEQEAAAKQAEELEDDDDTRAGAKICASGDVAGQDTDFCVFGLITLVKPAKAKFTPRRIEVSNQLLGSGELDQTIQDGLLKLLNITLDPGRLPFTVEPTSVNVQTGVLSVKGKAFDVTLGSGG